MKEKLSYNNEDLEVVIKFEDLGATEFMTKIIKMMTAIWYNEGAINKALDEVEV